MADTAKPVETGSSRRGGPNTHHTLLKLIPMGGCQHPYIRLAIGVKTHIQIIKFEIAYRNRSSRLPPTLKNSVCSVSTPKNRCETHVLASGQSIRMGRVGLPGPVSGEQSC